LKQDAYIGGYGLKWPRCGIISDVFNNISKFPNIQENFMRGIDFGCGLGAHGWLIETLGFNEVYYIDKSQVALDKAKDFLSSIPHKGSRIFCQNLDQVPDLPIQLIIDGASLQHIKKVDLEHVIDQIAHKLAKLEVHSKQDKRGLFVSEWVVSGNISQLTENFEHITFLHEINSYLDNKFETLSVSYVEIERNINRSRSTTKLANLVMSPR
jgi:SAM-dependent methyltransferase